MIASLSLRDPTKLCSQIFPFHPEAADSSTGNNLQPNKLQWKHKHDPITLKRIGAEYLVIKY